MDEQNNQPPAQPVTPSTPSLTPVVPTGSTPPVAQPEPITPPPVTNIPATGGNKLTKIIIGVIITLLILTAAVFAYRTFAKTPEQQIQAGIGKLLQEESLAFNGEIAAAEGTDSSEIPKTTLTGQFDSTGKGQFELTVNVFVSEIKLTLITVDEAAYLKVDGLGTVAPLISGGDADFENRLAQVNGKFIEITKEFIDQFTQNLGVDSDLGSALSDEDKKRVGEVFENADFLRVTEKLEAQDVDGVKAKGYRAVIEREGLIQMTRELKDLNIESLMITDELIANLESSTQEDYDSVPVDFYLADGRIVRVVLNLEEEPAATFTLNFSKFGEQVAVEKPADTMSLEEAFELLGSDLTSLFLGSGDTEGDF